MMMKIGTRVVKITHGEDDAHHVGALGTVMEAREAAEPFYLVKWDGDPEHVTYAVMASQIMCHQELKRLFKYGPKLNKTGGFSDAA